MRILVDKMPEKKEECLFYRKQIESYNGRFINTCRDCCSLNGKTCNFKYDEIIHRGYCRCLSMYFTWG